MYVVHEKHFFLDKTADRIRKSLTHDSLSNGKVRTNCKATNSNALLIRVDCEYTHRFITNVTTMHALPYTRRASQSCLHSKSIVRCNRSVDLDSVEHRSCSMEPWLTDDQGGGSQTPYG